MWYDLAVAAILLFCLIRGTKKGFVWQLAAIGSVILCFAFAETVSVATAPYLNLTAPLNRWVSMLLLYVACSFVCFAVARGLKSSLEKAKFDDYDRHLGGLFGLLKGAGIAVVLTFFAVTLSNKLRPTVLTSYSGHAAAVVMHQLAPLFPAELGKVIRPYLDNYEGLDEDPTGPRLVDGTSDPGDDLFGDGGGFDDDFDRAGVDDGGFGWDDDPHADAVARGTSEDDGLPPRDGAFGDSGFGDDPGIAERPEGAGQGGDWFDSEGGFNSDRLVGEGERLARDLWDDVPAETRDGVTGSLRDGVRRRVDEEVDRRVGEFFGGANANAGGPSRGELLDSIAARYTQDPAAHDAFRSHAEGMLRGVPEGVVGDVLRDWLADLRGPSAGADPNPTTSIQTQLPARIRAGVSARVAAPGEPPARAATTPRRDRDRRR